MSAPARLDLWLVANRHISRSAAQALVAAGAVRVNGRPARAGQRVGDHDSVVVSEPLTPPLARVAPASPSPAVPLHVVYEDEMIAVIDKPFGLVVHPAPGHPHGTLADGLRQRGDVWSFLGGAERPGIVHRLDRTTSGLLVVAKTEAAHRSLSAQLAARTLGRTYWAMVWGGFTETTGEIDKPIGRDPRQRQRMAVTDRGRAAQTQFRVVERLGALTVLDVTLRTGRTHQIRVHLASIGRPIVGDPVYGRRRGAAADRPALHARRLQLVHPGDGSERVFESPLPGDLESLLERARRGELR
jgi:23S rRNA pseudouridine1911/1915/1917 synthase